MAATFRNLDRTRRACSAARAAGMKALVSSRWEKAIRLLLVTRSRTDETVWARESRRLINRWRKSERADVPFLTDARESWLDSRLVAAWVEAEAFHGAEPAAEFVLESESSVDSETVRHVQLAFLQGLLDSIGLRSISPTEEPLA